MKKILPVLIAICILFSFSSVAFAADPSPATPVSQFSGDESEYDPIGKLSEEQRQELLHPIMPMHVSGVIHFHEITAITSQYRGERNRGIVAETHDRVNRPTHLTYSGARTVSNSYGVSISFEKGVVSLKVGYDVTYSTTETAGYILDLAENQMGSITLYDRYDVTKFNARTAYQTSSYPNPLTYRYEYGTGWSEEWTNFAFGATVW